MAIFSIKSKLPPPEKPNENQGDWKAAENELGTALPADYKDFINTYGSGKILDFLIVLNPFSTRKNINLISRMLMQSAVFKELEDEYDIKCPFPVYPERGGILPCALTDNGDVIFWITNGNPNEWNIIINESRGPDYESINLNIVDFITYFISGEIKTKTIPDISQFGDKGFKPI